jgi:hypothetical protein
VVSVTSRPRFTPGEWTPVPPVQEAGWAPEPVWKQRVEEKTVAFAGDRYVISEKIELLKPVINVILSHFIVTNLIRTEHRK